MLLSFVCCNKQVEILEDNLTQNSKVNTFFKSEDYQKSKKSKRLILSKKLAAETTLNSHDTYLIYNNISYLYSKLNKVDSAIFYTKKMLKLSKVEINANLKGKAFFKLGVYYNQKNLKDSAYFFYIKSKKEFFKLKDSIYLGKSLTNLAIIESDFGSYSISDSLAVESLKFFNNKEPNIIASIFNCLAINAKKRYLNTEAIAYYNAALKISTSKSSIIKYKNNIAIAHKEFKNYSKSILIFENLLKDTVSSEKTKIRIIDNLAYVKWLQDPTKKVLKELLWSKSLREQQKDSDGLIASYKHLSEYYNKKNRDISLDFALKMYKVSKKVKSTQDVLEAIDKIVKITAPQKAIKYYKESIHLRDSLKEAETKRQYKFAKIKYNYEEEEKQKLKFKTLAAENKLTIEQEKSKKKNIFIIGLLITSGLVFLIYRRKHQHKRRILQESYNTETRIARRLHDELGNGIYNVITKVQNPKFSEEEIISDLDKVYLQTRKISHENDSIETGVDFENYFRGLISSYNSDYCKIILKGVSSLGLNKLETEKQVVIYRVFNELFVNMRKHSEANLVVLSCKKTNNRLEMIYTDNGVGFKENIIVLKNGLKNMETRIKTINGTINFENKPNKGLKVSIHFKN